MYVKYEKTGKKSHNQINKYKNEYHQNYDQIMSLRNGAI